MRVVPQDCETPAKFFYLIYQLLHFRDDLGRRQVEIPMMVQSRIHKVKWNLPNRSWLVLTNIIEKKRKTEAIAETVVLGKP